MANAALETSGPDLELDAEIAALGEMMAAMAGGDPGELRELRELLIGSLSVAAALPGLAVAGDRRALRFQAHALRGSAATAGLAGIAEAAAAIERGHQTAPLPELEAAALRLRVAVDRVLAALRRADG